MMYIQPSNYVPPASVARFKAGKQYRVSLAAYKRDMGQDAVIPNWILDYDGRRVTLVSSDQAMCDGYCYIPCWCEEIKEDM